MKIVVADILAAAMRLSVDDRAALAHELIVSLGSPGGLSEDDPNFLAELERRSSAMDRDPSSAIPWDEVERQLRQKLEDRRKS